MASKSRQAFMMPEEFLAFADECWTSLNLGVVLDRVRGPQELWDGSRGALLASDQLFFADRATVTTTALSESSSPARLGWVQANVPKVQDNRLFCIQIGARRDWFDRDTGSIHINKDAPKRFDRIWRRFATQLRFPIRARNLVTGAEAAYSSFGYSPGAAKWWAEGGQLRQRGVENLEFMLPDITRE